MGRGFSPATFLGKERKVKPEELPNVLIPHLLIAYNRDLVTFIRDQLVTLFPLQR